MQINVATYNIAGAVKRTQRFYGALCGQRAGELFQLAATGVTRIAGALRDADVDIVALQEADVSYDGRRQLLQWEEIARRLGMQATFLPSFDVNLLSLIRARSGVATLASFSTTFARAVPFGSRHLSPEQRLKRLISGRRSALHVTLDVGGRSLHVVNAHLTHDNAKRREHELATLLDYCASMDPVLLVGDLNLTPHRDWPSEVSHPQPIHDDCMAILRRFADRYTGTLHCDARLRDFAPDADDLDPISTSPAEAPRYKFDYIFLLTHSDSISLGSEQVLSSDVSDHRAVVARLTLD